MKRILKWSGITAGFLLLVVLLVAGGVYFASERRLNKRYNVTVQPVARPAAADAGALEHGGHIAQTRGCLSCHGPDLGGSKVVDDPLIGRWHAPNLTRGAGGVSPDYGDIDYLRAIRHGVNRNGRPLLLMPSHEFAHFSDRDMGDLLAYLNSVPPVNRERVPLTVGPLARALILANKITIPAERIDHGSVAPQNILPGVTVEYGKYLAVGCQGCHRPGYTGGKIAGAPPHWPPAADLTREPGTPFATWTEADFMRAMREGRRPDGSEINRAMPWRALGKMTDDELGAIWLYLSRRTSAGASD